MHQPQTVHAIEHADDDYPRCNDLIVAAEREFVAFTTTITELFGPEQAMLSADDWLDELASIDCLPRPARCDWRLIAVAALARLTIRMTLDLRQAVTTGRGD